MDPSPDHGTAYGVPSSAVVLPADWYSLPNDRLFGLMPKQDRARQKKHRRVATVWGAAGKGGPNALVACIPCREVSQN